MFKKGKRISQDSILLISGVLLLLVLIGVVVYSFIFLANNVLPAVNTPESGAGEQVTHFNIEGFEELGL